MNKMKRAYAEKERGISGQFSAAQGSTEQHPQEESILLKWFFSAKYLPYYDVCIRFQSPRHKLSLTSLRLSSLLSNMLWSSLLTIHSNIHFGTKNLYFSVESFSSKVFVQINIDRIFLGKMVGCLFIPKGDIEILIYQNIWY